MTFLLLQTMIQWKLSFLNYKASHNLTLLLHFRSFTHLRHQFIKRKTALKPYFLKILTIKADLIEHDLAWI